jgi:hypothetical protein
MSPEVAAAVVCVEVAEAGVAEEDHAVGVEGVEEVEVVRHEAAVDSDAEPLARSQWITVIRSHRI